MKIRTYLFLGLSALALQSCDSFLSNKPKGYTIPENFEDYAKLLNHSSLQYSSDPVLNYITDDLYLTSEGEVKDEKGKDFTQFDFSGAYDHERNLYSFKGGQVLTPGNTDPLWNDAYGRIYVYNSVANNIMDVMDATEDKKRAVRAEALVGRAFEYLNLVNTFAKHYDPATAENDYGVPIVLSEEVVNTVYVRNSVKEVYDLILQDLEEAVRFLPKVTPNVYHPNRSIGFAFLSRVYLYMGAYKKALENANHALELNNELHEFKPYTTIHSTFGRIVRADDHNITFPEDVKNKENIFMRSLSGSGNIFNAVAASKDLIETYKSHLSKDGEDMRFRLFFATDSANFTMNASAKPKHFEGYSTYAPYINLNVGFTTPEIYLIAAECEARTGNYGRCIELLNTLRDKRIKNNVHYTTADTPTKEAALRLVVDERRREFAFCGPTRLFDLKRLNREDWFKKDITHTADGDTWTLPANDLRYIMPVPQTILDFNPNMPQYDRPEK